MKPLMIGNPKPIPRVTQTPACEMIAMNVRLVPYGFAKRTPNARMQKAKRMIEKIATGRTCLFMAITSIPRDKPRGRFSLRIIVVAADEECVMGQGYSEGIAEFLRVRFNEVMDEAKLAIDKLQRIQKLWTELGRTKSDAPEYGTIMKEIRALSAEYQTLVEAAKKRET
jgi:hypothetical protein